MQELDERLAEWADEGLITKDQATHIAEHERDRPRGEDGGLERPSRHIAAAEAVGYVGAALALAALVLLLRDVWPELNVFGELALVGLLTVLTAGAGQAVHDRPAPAMQRLTGVLWAASVIGSAWLAGIVASDLLELGSDATATIAGAVAVATAVPLLLRRPSPPLQLVGLAGAVMTAMSALALSTLEPDVLWRGLLVAAIGGAWLLLGRGGWIEPARTAEVFGGVTALLGAQFGSIGGFFDVRVSGLIVGLAIAGILVALAVLRDAGHHLVVGALGLFVFVPQLVFELFEDAIGAPATLLVIGLLLVLLAVGLGWARRDVADDDGQRGDGPNADDRARVDR